jgi:cyclohexa-1,5-dienecarbonyl-CoA hydratase
VVEDSPGGSEEVSEDGPGFAVTREAPGSATLRLCRAPANVLDIATLERLAGVLARLSAEPPLALVITGEPHFCAGVAIEDHVPERIGAMLEAFHGLLRAILAFPAPTIARIAGACLGGGAEIALACDLVFAAEDARIGFPEIGLACFPPAAAVLLPGAIGQSAAADWVLSGTIASGREAERRGFAGRVFPRERLEEGVAQFAAELAGRSRPAVTAALAVLRAPRRALFDRSIGAAEEAYARLSGSPELAEAIARFRDRKRPAAPGGPGPGG